jgi:hypothetical protein
VAKNVDLSRPYDLKAIIQALKHPRLQKVGAATDAYFQRPFPQRRRAQSLAPRITQRLVQTVVDKIFASLRIDEGDRHLIEKYKRRWKKHLLKSYFARLNPWDKARRVDQLVEAVFAGLRIDPNDSAVLSKYKHRIKRLALEQIQREANRSWRLQALSPHERLQRAKLRRVILQEQAEKALETRNREMLEKSNTSEALAKKVAPKPANVAPVNTNGRL